MEILLLLGIYCVELVCYQVVLKILFQVEVRNRKWMVLGGVLALIIEFLPVNVAGKNVLVTGSVFVVMFLSIQSRIIEKGIRLLLTQLTLACIDDIFSYPCEQIFSGHYYLEYVSCLVAKCCAILSIFLLYVFKEKFLQKEAHINSIIYFIIILIIGLMLLCLSIMNQVINYFPNDKYILFCNIFNIAILISIFLLVIFIIYIKNTHERMEQLLKTETLLKNSQVSYYKQILKKEADTRKYRHDMINHLIYVQEILCKDRILDAKNYLSNILGGFKKIQNTYYVIGNDMVDTIMNYSFGMLPKNVAIKVNGKCPVIIDMEDTDVCTIFSNLFQNAVVENSPKESHIIVEAKKGHQFVEYKIRNSLFREINERNIGKHGLPKTHKSDKRNHGIGMINIKNTIEKVNGKFEWYQSEGDFCVDVILPIRNK